MTDHLPQPPPLPEIGEAALFLDFDGTVVALAERPDAIAVAPGLGGKLEALARRMDGRVALVSGRYLEDIDRHLGPAGIVMAGSHGAELRRADGAPWDGERRTLPAEAVAAAKDFAGGHDRLLVEEKPFGIGLHYRADPALEADVLSFAEALAGRHGLSRKHGKMVVELMAAPADKGAAVRAIMADNGFAGAMPVFVGDDVTDEDGFRAASALGGFGILVGEPRATAARYRLADVEEVHEWLGL